MNGTIGDWKYPCPCCGQVVFAEPANSGDVCPVCFWGCTVPQIRKLHMTHGNKMVEKLRAVVRKYDPEHFLDIGAPTDEYDDYIRRIIALYDREGLNPDSLRTVFKAGEQNLDYSSFREELAAVLNNPRSDFFDSSTLRDAGKQILAEIRARRSRVESYASERGIEVETCPV